MAGIFCIIEVFFSETFLFVGMCRFSGAFARDLDIKLKAFDEYISSLDGKLSLFKQSQVKRKFVKLIRFQGDSKM